MSRHILTMKRPSSWHREQWREALMLGNGLTGAMIHGAIAEETIRFNRYNLWHNGAAGGEIPDISDTFRNMREQILRGEYAAANTNCMEAALVEKGYHAHPECPSPLGQLRISFRPEKMFTHYERGVDMRAGEAFVRFRMNDTQFERRAFVSRDSDIFVMSVTADAPFTAGYRFDLHRKEDAVCDFAERSFACRTADGNEGANVFFVGEIRTWVDNNRLMVEGSRYLVFVQAWGVDAPEDISAELSRSYDELLARHSALHTPLYDTVSIELADDEAHKASNDQLLNEAYEDIASPALIEKLWRFGRYLFISASSEKGHPIPLYGLWHGEDNAPWCQYVANENVQMTYWHAMSGGLSYALPILIRYYTDRMDTFRECAKKLFGMRGIWLSAYTTPGVAGPCVPVGVISNWISCAGWLSRHFWEYYRFTGDTALLKERILPFMHETALFYLDYVLRDENGKALICPSVSPENSPENLMPKNPDFSHTSHPASVVKNATMDFAVMKELLTTLLQGMEETGLYAEDAEAIRELRNSIPEYAVNEDGAVKEWISDDLADRYNHRHLSHIYPVFPGNEVNRENQPELFRAFRRAVDLRELGGQSGWSLTHMSNIYSRMDDGEEAIACLDILAKSVVNNALITTHSDWRHMGMTMDDGEFAAVQLDANFGAISAVQEMLLRWSDGLLFILPALPRRLKTGRVQNIAFPDGQADIEWDEAEIRLTLRAGRDFSVGLVVADKRMGDVSLKKDETFSQAFAR